MRRPIKKKIHIEPDLQYQSLLVSKIINKVMMEGKKSLATRIVYEALEIAEKKTKKPALEVLETAISNASPSMELKSRRVGGANYQVPIEVRPERRTALAIRWIVEATRKRPNKEFKTFEEKLAAELLAAVNNEGEAAKKKDVMHRQAEANKA